MKINSETLEVRSPADIPRRQARRGLLSSAGIVLLAVIGFTAETTTTAHEAEAMRVNFVPSEFSDQKPLSEAMLLNTPTVGGVEPEVISNKIEIPESGFLSSKDISSLVRPAAERHGISPALLKAVIYTESSGKVRAVSKQGACGLMQLMPATAKELGVTDLFDPAQSVEAGAKYLASLMRSFKGNATDAIAAYNSGPARIKRLKGGKYCRETRNFVKRVNKYTTLFEKEFTVTNS